MTEQFYVFVHSTRNYNVNTPTNLHLTNQCLCCLARNIPFISLRTCNHTGFLDFISKFKMQFREMSICYSCHYMLKKFDTFKQRAEENLTVLTQQLQKPPSKSGVQLERSDIFITDSTVKIEVAPSTDYKNNGDRTHSESEQKEVLHFQAGTISTLKVEFDSSDETTPMEDGTNVEEKKPVSKEPKNTSYPEDVYNGRIRMRVYTEEEMLRDRESRRKMESYLKKPFKCEDCIQGFDHEIMLKGHMERQHEKNKILNLKCHICKSMMGSDSSYKSHIRNHYTRFECCACGKIAHNLMSIETHYNTVHGDMGTRYYCDTCTFVTNKNNDYRSHKDSCMKKKKRHDCQLCASSLGTATALRIHMSTVHNQSSRRFSCTLCDKSYKVASALTNHVTSCHSGDTTFSYCEICDKQFKNIYSLGAHRKTHTNHVAEGRFECDDCGAKYRTKSTLTSHMQSEHLNTVLKCDKCPKTYKSALGLKTHVKNTHKKKPPSRNKICNHCGKGFTTQAILTCHIRTHTGERPLICTYCPATFAHMAALYNHKKLVHKHKTKGRVSLEYKTSDLKTT